MLKLHLSRTIYYKSRNGFSGELYGESSMSIYDPDGREVMHTASRTPNTQEELKKIVDGMPAFIKTFERVTEDL